MKFPPHVQPFADEILATHKRIGLEAPSEESLELAAWARWAGGLKNFELADVILAFRQRFIKPECCELGCKLEEAWRRLRKRPGYVRRKKAK